MFRKFSQGCLETDVGRRMITERKLRYQKVFGKSSRYFVDDFGHIYLAEIMLVFGECTAIQVLFFTGLILTGLFGIRKYPRERENASLKSCFLMRC